MKIQIDEAAELATLAVVHKAATVLDHAARLETADGARAAAIRKLDAEGLPPAACALHPGDNDEFPGTTLDQALAAAIAPLLEEPAGAPLIAWAVLRSHDDEFGFVLAELPPPYVSVSRVYAHIATLDLGLPVAVCGSIARRLMLLKLQGNPWQRPTGATPAKSSTAPRAPPS